MQNPDDSLDALRRIRSEFRDFCALNGAVTEADTRAKVIDRVLKEVLCWPESHITRENHVGKGYFDYSLRVQNTPFICVEAKREGLPFTLPAGKIARVLKLNGTILTIPAIQEAICQVRGYCDDAGIRYAVATNGYTWIIFRAIRDGSSWRKGNAIVFSSLTNIEENFTAFWNLLSFSAVSCGTLDTEFGVPHRVPRQMHRVINNLFNADLPLQRNRLYLQLQPLIKAIFDDIAEQHQLEILQSCYVHTESLRIVATDLNCVITDAVPAFLAKEGALQIDQGEKDSGQFGTAMLHALRSNKGQLILLLGGIGAGKTTFLRRYQKDVGKDALDNHAFWFHVDFLAAPIDSNQLENFIWRSLQAQIRSRYAELQLEKRHNLELAFVDKIAAIKETILSGLQVDSPEYNRILSRHLRKWQDELTEYIPRLLRVCQAKNDRSIVVFIDNVDQLSPAYQAQIFLLAQKITRDIGSMTVVALREESYYVASIQKTFTAYNTRKFHIASPHFKRMIHNRIQYALSLLEREPDAMPILLPSGILFARRDISDFLKIVEFSIFKKNRNIGRFIETICFGNMRMALRMFGTFLTSGATDVDKMLAIYNREGSYFVAYHEFVKSIMLGERYYYKEAHSPIMNIFDCGSEKNSSHFTSLRILNLLVSHRGESSSEGQGYMEVSNALALFEDVFDNREDFIRSADRLIERQLIETNTRTPLQGASHLRATSAGLYYVHSLIHSFPYLDLVLQDTPLNDEAVERSLRNAVFTVNNLNDKEEEKISRMEVRFNRVQEFLDYLGKEEIAESEQFRLNQFDSVIAKQFVPTINEHFISQRKWISRRLYENRERVEEEFEIPAFEIGSAEEDFLEAINEEDNPEVPPTLPGI